MRSPEFEAMLAPARLYPELWRLFLGLLTILFGYAGGVAILAVLLFAAVGPLEFFGWVRRVQSPTEPVPTLLLLATFYGMALGAILAAGACHFRGPGSLFGPRGETLRGFLTACVVALPLYLGLTAFGAYFDAPLPNLAWADWLGWLPYALPLILVQVSAEELIFRGYLPQQLAVRFRAPWIWFGLPAAIFAALHVNPAVPLQSNAVVIASAFLFALIATDLTRRTGSLGAAIGLHFVNNATGLLTISVSGTITGLSRWVTPDDIATVGLGAAALDLAFFVVLWRILVWVLDR